MYKRYLNKEKTIFIKKDGEHSFWISEYTDNRDEVHCHRIDAATFKILRSLLK